MNREDPRFRRRATTQQPAKPVQEEYHPAGYATALLLCGSWFLWFPHLFGLLDWWFWAPTWLGIAVITLGLLMVGAAVGRMRR